MTYPTYTVEQFHEFNGQNVHTFEYVGLDGPLAWVIGEAKRRFSIQREGEPMRNAVQVVAPSGDVVWTSLSAQG
jgi:hypothetical protein